MVKLTPHMKIYVSTAPADFRRHIDGLSAMCRNVLRQNPDSGAVFVFRNKKATAIRLLVFDTQGHWLMHKRLARGKFKWWPTADKGPSWELAAHELQLLLWNADPSSIRAQPAWKGLNMHH